MPVVRYLNSVSVYLAKKKGSNYKGPLTVKGCMMTCMSLTYQIEVTKENNTTHMKNKDSTADLKHFFKDVTHLPGNLKA